MFDDIFSMTNVVIIPFNNPDSGDGHSANNSYIITPPFQVHFGIRNINN